MALSAIDSSVSASSLSSGPMAMPMLQDGIRLVLSSVSTSWSSSSMILPATVATALRSVTLSSSTMNSSPPQRDTVSPLRIAALRRWATIFSTWSPHWWPRLSLMRLKRSRSTNSKATRLPLRLACVSAWRTRSSSRVRLGRPVRGSWVASCSRRAVNAIDSVTSLKASTAPSLPLPIGARVRRSAQGSPSAERQVTGSDRRTACWPCRQLCRSSSISFASLQNCARNGATACPLTRARGVPVSFSATSLINTMRRSASTVITASVIERSVASAPRRERCSEPRVCLRNSASQSA